MLKKVILVFIILGLVAGIFYLFSIAPYHIYTLTLTEGVDTKFLKMSPTTPNYYDGSILTYDTVDPTLVEAKNLTKELHIKNFDMTLLINHPAISFIPNIKVESNQVKLGADFLDARMRHHFSFMIENEKKFSTNLVNQELYFLPYFRNYIDKKDELQKWDDLFSKVLSLPSNEGKSFYESLKILNQYSYQELVYNLYILNNRVNILPYEFEKIKFEPNSHIGLVTLNSNAKILEERIFVLNQGFIYPITIKTNLNSNIGIFARKLFIEKLKFHQSTKDSAIPIYAFYHNFEYQERIGEKGMIYLYSAWSHDIDNKEYIRVIITFLERGKSNIKYLKSFYDYAFKKFGSNLSLNSEFLLETAQEKLKRSVKEELETEIKREEQTGISSGNESASDEEKIKMNLQRAKEKKTNSDEKERQLSIE